MLTINVITLFPEYFAPLSLSIPAQAAAAGSVTYRIIQLRDFTHDRHKTVDDYPYGGGAGMVMKPDPFFEAVESIGAKAPIVLLSPRGRRFTQSDGEAATGIADLYADEHIGPKVVLHIMDALLAQFAGGPRFNPNYAFSYHTIYASKDPVALDANALRLIEGWRKEAKLPPIGRRAEWLESAEQMGLGHYAESRITLRPVGPE